MENGTVFVSIYLFTDTGTRTFTFYRRFDRKEKSMIKLIDVHLMCAMAPPYRGGKDVTPRFKRHFVVLTVSEFEDEVMFMIFSKIILWHLDTRFV